VVGNISINGLEEELSSLSNQISELKDNLNQYIKNTESRLTELDIKFENFKQSYINDDKN
jgi:regulator of replication initiation timing